MIVIDFKMPKACVWEKTANEIDACKLIHLCPCAKTSLEKRPKDCPIKGEVFIEGDERFKTVIFKGLVYEPQELPDDFMKNVLRDCD